MKSNNFVRQLVGYTSILVVLFILHFGLLYQFSKGIHTIAIVGSYVFNWICTLAFFTIVRYGSKTVKRQLGFVFLYFSLGKFLLFLLFIKPSLPHFDGLRSAAFFYFFIPYAISMVYETVSTVRILNAK